MPVGGGGRSAHVRDVRDRYLTYGPYTTDIPAGRVNVNFYLMVDNVSANNDKVATIDIYGFHPEENSGHSEYLSKRL